MLYRGTYGPFGMQMAQKKITDARKSSQNQEEIFTINQAETFTINLASLGEGGVTS